MKRAAQATPVPLVVCEEHHEAFYVWNDAIRRGWLPPGGNTLLHFDEHADMALPRLTRPVPDGPDRAALAAWVYGELRIDDFIVPAFHRGIFDRLEWFRRRHVGLVKRARVFTGSVRGEGRELLYGQWLARTRRHAPPDVRLAHYRAAGVDEPARRRRNVVLDFDLDYFLCHPRPVFADRRIYLSAAEFARVTGNRYHFLFTAPGARVRAGREGGRRFLEFGGGPAAGAGETLADGLRRVAAAGAFLARQPWRPRLIVIARSRHSGYTPAAHWRKIERALLAELRRLYPLREVTIDRLQAGGDGP